jgi:hypothetical protein
MICAAIAPESSLLKQRKSIVSLTNKKPFFLSEVVTDKKKPRSQKMEEEVYGAISFRRQTVIYLP